jgi:kynureninase
MSSAETPVVELDSNDPLSAARKLFHLPKDLIYLDGNSLGAAPHAAFEEIEKTAKNEWAHDLIGSWNSARWFELPSDLGAVVADLIGAASDEVVVCDTTSINIFKALHAALSLRPGRGTIVAEAGSFPTDLYMVEGVLSSSSACRIALEGVDGSTIEELIDEDTAVVLVNHVDYRSGQIRDIGTLARLAHEKGALIIVDLCHSAGIMPVELNHHDIDLAIGCTYKYLNGGPGSPAFIYCAKRHLGTVSQPLSGWWGHDAPFAFDRQYRADPGIRKFLCGTQPILSFRAMKPGLEITRQFDMKDIRAKSMGLTGLFLQLVESFCDEHDVGIFSPRDASQRGSQISLTHEHGYKIVQAMIERGVIGDFRMPNIMRFGFAPLYISYQDTFNAAMILKDVLESGVWQEPRFAQKSAVT